MEKSSMKKPMLIMLIVLGVFFGGIFIWKSIKSVLVKRHFAKNGNPTQTVSAITVGYSSWQPQLKSVGSARAIKGVNVTTELAGLVQTIYFTPGTIVKKGTVLVQLNAGTEIGQLQALQAQAQLDLVTYNRDKLQYKVRAISKQQLDNDKYNLKNLQGQVASQAATVAKKTIRAPFTGRLGVSSVNPGQYLNVGDTVATLQQMDPIWVDFYLPQQSLSLLKFGQIVTVKADTFPNKSFTGKITTIQPLIDVNTRNVEVEATVANPHYELAPGMYNTVEVKSGKPKAYLTVPQTAVSFNPYGDISYVLKEKGKDEKGKLLYIATQVFVTTGETRGDQITILRGLSAGDKVVTSGQLKLRNGTVVAINNAVPLENSPDPKVNNEHEELYKREGK